MKKIKMNHLPLLLAMVFLALLSACGDNDDSHKGGDSNESEIKRTITFKAGVNEASKPKVIVEDDAVNSDAGNINVKWNVSSDKIRVFSSTGNADFAIDRTENDDKMGYFTGTISGSAPYSLFVPANKAAATWRESVFDMTAQKQIGNDNLSHLMNYHYMTTTQAAEWDEDSEVYFDQYSALLKFVVTLPDDAVAPKRLIITTKDRTNANAFCVRKHADPAQSSRDEYSSQMTLDLEGVTGTTFTAYMMVLPTTLKDRLEMSVECANGKFTFGGTFSSTFKYEAGVLYASTVDYKSGSANYSKAEIFDDALAGIDINDLIDGGVDFTGGGTLSNPYLITNVTELKFLIGLIEVGLLSDAYGSDAHFKLTTDIHVTASEWTPIGVSETSSSSEKYYFDGHFDGNGHTVSGKLKAAPGFNKAYFGFFGYAKDGSIKDLNITADIECVSSYNEGDWQKNKGVFVGGVVGYSESAISDCNNFGIISGTTSTPNNSITSVQSGGIAGYSSSVTNCNNFGPVSGESSSFYAYVGGIAGQYASVTNCNNYGLISGSTSAPQNTAAYAAVGGIAGQQIASSSNINNSDNYGTVEASVLAHQLKSYAGGIVGTISQSSVSVTNCHNNGAISSFSPTMKNMTETYAGGIAGGLTTSGTSVSNCSNFGSVESESVSGNLACAGGIAGVNSGTLTGNKNQTMNIEAIKFGNQYAGGIAGRNMIGGSADGTNTSIFTPLVDTDQN